MNAGADHTHSDDSAVRDAGPGQIPAAPDREAVRGQPLSLAGPHNPWLVALVVSTATFMEVLDTSIANVSLRHIAGSLAASSDEATWVLTSYLVSNAVVLPISGWLATAIGRKPFYMTCVALFTISSLLCGMAPSLGWLIFFRVLQGIGGGGLAPSEQSILADTFPQAQRGLAFAVYGVAVVVAPAVGPTLGGWITDNYSWHWIFLINVPIGALSLLASSLFLVEPEAETRRHRELFKRGLRIDYVGIALVGLGLGCLQVVLDKGEREDWFSSTFIVTFAAVSGTSLVLLLVWELTRDDPIVDLPLLKDRGFLASNVIMFALGFILFGTTQLLPQLVQEQVNYTATYAGLVITPGGVAVMFLMPVVGLLLKVVQPRTLIVVGFAISAAALYNLSHLNHLASFRDFLWARVVQASGIAFLFIPVSMVAYIGLAPGKSNNASALINLSRNLGGSFGISLIQTLFARRGQFHRVHLSSHLTEFDSAFRQAVGDAPVTSLGTASPALAALGRAMQQQAAMLSYIDVFYVLMWMSLLMLPLAALLRKAPPGQAAGGH